MAKANLYGQYNVRDYFDVLDNGTCEQGIVVNDTKTDVLLGQIKGKIIDDFEREEDLYVYIEENL